LGEKVIDRKIRTALRGVRNVSFDPDLYKMEEIIGIFSEISKILSVGDEKALGVASFIIRKCYGKDNICDYFRRLTRNRNDIKRWGMEQFSLA